MDRKIFVVRVTIAIVFAVVVTSCNNKEEVNNNSLKESIIATLREHRELSEFTDALNGMDFSNINSDKLTVFAATNSVYSKLTLRSSESEAECDYVYINRHLVEGKYLQSGLIDSMQIKALDGTMLLVTVYEGRTYINGVELVSVIPTENNAVYIVESAICTNPKPNYPVTGITISQSSLSLDIGETEFIKVFVEPNHASNQKVIWQNTNPDAVEVKEVSDSLIFSITALSAGKAEIKFTTTDSGGYSATCTVTVSDANSQSNFNQEVIIDEIEYFNASDYSISIIDMQIVDNCLKIKFGVSGCSVNNVKLITTGAIEKTLPPQRTLLLSLDEPGLCTMYITKDVSFNIEKLQVQGYNKVYLNVLGKGILYEY